MTLKALFFLLSACLLHSVAAHRLVITALYPDENLYPSDVVYIRGNGSSLNWSTGKPCTHSAANTWTFTLDVPDESTGTSLAFKFLVDDQQWQVGANEMVILPSSDSSVTCYPFFASSVGRLLVIPDVVSKTLGNSRSVRMYLPPSYEENPFKSYPTLLMHDGQNLFTPNTSAFGVAWLIQDTINELIVEGDMREIIVVGVDNAGAERTDEYTYCRDPTINDGGKADVFLDWLESDIFPLVNKNFRTENANTWDMGGSSLGGLLSAYAGWTRPAKWNVNICMSSSFWFCNQSFNSSILVKYPRPEQHDKFYLDSGNAGPGKDDVTETLTVRAHLEELGYVLGSDLFYYLDQGGQHNEAYWGKRFHVPMTDLYAPIPSTTTPL